MLMPLTETQLLDIIAREGNDVTQLYKPQDTFSLLMVSETIIESVKDAIAVVSSVVESAEREIAWLLPAPMLVMGAQYNVGSKDLIQKGGRVRGITTISSPYVKTVSELLDAGVDVRHIENYTGSFMLVADKQPKH